MGAGTDSGYRVIFGGMLGGGKENEGFGGIGGGIGGGADGTCDMLLGLRGKGGG